MKKLLVIVLVLSLGLMLSGCVNNITQFTLEKYESIIIMDGENISVYQVKNIEQFQIKTDGRIEIGTEGTLEIYPNTYKVIFVEKEK